MSIFIKNKCTKWYYNIINSAILNKRITGYNEKHHIIPKSLGGDNSNNNLVLLTAREHFICHALLPKMTVGKDKAKMVYAARMMCVVENKSQHRYVNARMYHILKEQYRKQLMGHPQWGPFKQSDESNKKHSETLKGRKLPPRTKEHIAKLTYIRTLEQRAAISKARAGVSWGSHTEEHKKYMSEIQKGKKQTTQKCKHCDKVISNQNHTRWHGDNCKLSPNKVF